MLQSLVTITLGQLATGILIFIAFVPPSKIGAGFGRFHAVLALVLWLIALRATINLPLIVLVFLLLLVAVFSAKEQIYYPALLSSIITSFYILLAQEKAGIFHGLLIHLPGILVLGSSSVAMLLGHWYLVSPKLSIFYLQGLTIGLILAILIRSGFVLQAVVANTSQLERINFFQSYGLFFLQRIILGLGLTLILAILTYACVRIRSTQSATGILYVILVFCLIGELIGSYLFLKTGLAF
jgi:hypothetical protein